MKKLVGFLIALFSLAFIVLLILRIWNIVIFGWADILRSGLTLVLIAIAIIILIIVRFVFFRKENYDASKGNKAHPM